MENLQYGMWADIFKINPHNVIYYIILLEKTTKRKSWKSMGKNNIRLTLAAVSFQQIYPNI